MLAERELWGGSEVRSLVLFTRGRYGADRLARMLHRRNFVAAVLDDFPSQQEREQALEDLRRGRTQILVASDGAGRSLDLSGVSHVVNYDVPQTPEDYAHRLGRPGRPDAPGNMFTLMSTEEQKDLVGIERLLGRTIERSFLPAFDYGMRPSEIKQVLSYDDEWTRPKRPVGGLQSAAVRIAGGPAVRVPTPLKNPAPPAPAIPTRPMLSSAPAPPLRTLAPSPPKKPAATPGRPWLSPPKPSPSSHAKQPAGTKRPLSGAAKKSAAAKKAGVAAQQQKKLAGHPAKKEPSSSHKRKR
jgi:superfamily II DNA/RNA helicase